MIWLIDLSVFDISSSVVRIVGNGFIVSVIGLVSVGSCYDGCFV